MCHEVPGRWGRQQLSIMTMIGSIGTTGSRQCLQPLPTSPMYVIAAMGSDTHPQPDYWVRKWKRQKIRPNEPHPRVRIKLTAPRRGSTRFLRRGIPYWVWCECIRVMLKLKILDSPARQKIVPSGYVDDGTARNTDLG